MKLSIEARIRELKADGMITLKIGHCFNLAWTEMTPTL